jgi:putative transcriptional regulator
MPGKTRDDKQPLEAPGETDWAAFDAMTDDQAEAAARGDPGAPPLAPGRRMHRIAKVKRIRWVLKLSRGEFAERYHIPLAIVERWERYQEEPDAVAGAFLDAIAADPQGVAAALAKSGTAPAAAE